MHDLTVTLVAVATPPGRGGIGCVRISGPAAQDVAGRLFRRKREDDPATGRPVFGQFVGRDGQPIDHGYLVLFDRLRSYSGEPTAELWGHGSPAVLSEIVATALAAGARAAGPGEFTYRALRNGRLDLARAEAVRDLVAARTLYQARLAFSQAEGSLSRRVAPMREALAQIVVRAEAALEFADESETHLPPGVLVRELDHARALCAGLLAGFRTGRLVREGASLVLTGLPNVGKSSLFNRLLEQDRAIIAAAPGTTRDTLEETLDLGGVPVRLVDTAGLRDETDPVEEEGVRRARRARQEADLVLLVLDASRQLEPKEAEAIQELESELERERTVVVVNKADLVSPNVPALPRASALLVSAKTGQGIDLLRERLTGTLLGASSIEDPVLTNARHAQALKDASRALDRALEALGRGFTEEVVLVDLNVALDHVGTITGAFSNEDLYDRIFSTFCIGK